MNKTVNIKHLYASIDASVLTMRSLGAHLPEFLRRREHEASDGYPARSMGGGTTSSGVSDPTLRAAMQKQADDPVATAIDAILRCIGEVDTLCRTIKNAQSQVLVIELNERGRQPSGQFCDACGSYLSGTSDATRGYIGFCRKHYDRWRGYSAKANGRGDLASRDVFIKLLQKELAEEAQHRGKKLVKA